MNGLVSRHRRRRNRMRRAPCLYLPGGSKLFDLDHPALRLYLLRSGRIRLSNGPDVIFDDLTRGHFFGEKVLLPRWRRGQVAHSLLPAKLIAFRKSEFLKLLSDPRFVLRVLRSLVDRLDRCEQTIRDLVTEPVGRRLARRLLRLAPLRPVTGWVRLPCEPSNPDLARMVGTTRWGVSHFLNQFRRLGWLRRQQGLWIQREGLSEFLRSSPPGRTGEH